MEDIVQAAIDLLIPELDSDLFSPDLKSRIAGAIEMLQSQAVDEEVLSLFDQLARYYLHIEKASSDRQIFQVQLDGQISEDGTATKGQKFTMMVRKLKK